jgi:hypothetical protein
MMPLLDEGYQQLVRLPGRWLRWKFSCFDTLLNILRQELDLRRAALGR